MRCRSYAVGGGSMISSRGDRERGGPDGYGGMFGAFTSRAAGASVLLASEHGG